MSHVDRFSQVPFSTVQYTALEGWSWHTWMGRVLYVVPCLRMNESCLIWMSHVSYEWVMAHMNGTCLICRAMSPYEWVMSHMNESCLVWMSHGTHEWDVPYMSCHVSYEWVMSHMNESRCILYCAVHGDGGLEKHDETTLGSVQKSRGYIHMYSYICTLIAEACV